MASITDLVKEGLKYPFNDGKKVLGLGAIFLFASVVSLLMNYLVYDSLAVMASDVPVETFQALLSAIPPTNMALVVLSWIVSFIILLFTGGYLYNVIKYGIEGKYELPDFKDIKGIFLNGIRTVIVGIAYSILPGILFILGIMLTVNENVGASVNSIGMIILFIAMIFALFVALFEVMAMCNMIAKDELKAAFRFKEILALIKNLGWGKFIGILLFAFVVIMVITVFLEFIFGAFAALISMIVGSAMALIIVKVILDALLINPYISIVMSRIYGSIYRQANGLELETVDKLESAGSEIAE